MARKRYFGWAGPDHFDARDLPYTVSNIVLAALPESVDLRPKFKLPVFDQQSIGSCGPNTAAGDLLFDQEQNSSPDIVPSRLFIYYNTREIMGTVNKDSGVYNRDLCKALNKYGWPDEQSWPYQIAKFREEPPASVYAEAETRKVVRYERVQQTLDQMKGALAQGDPFIFGFLWYSGWSSASRTGDLPMPKAGERPAGGHDVLIVGYDNATQRFIFRNSWGTGWGANGCGTIPYAFATNPMQASDFWTLHWDDAVVPPPPDPPPPPPPPTPSLKNYRISVRSEWPPLVEEV